MRKIYLLSICVLIPLGIEAQSTFDDFKRKNDQGFLSYKDMINKDFEDFRNTINREYATFIEKEWKEFDVIKGTPKPQEDKLIPPVVYSEEDKNKSIENKPKPYHDIIPIIAPKPQPQPVVPVKEVPKPVDVYFKFNYFGTKLQVRLESKHRFRLSSCNENDIAQAWSSLSSDCYNNVINDCLDIRDRYDLCDWAYLLMLRDLSNIFFSGYTNEATLLTAYLYCQSGYKMRLASADNQLYLLYASEHTIYEKNYWDVDGEKLYSLDCNLKQLYICQVMFPNERSLSLQINTVPKLEESLSPQRVLQSSRFQDVKAVVNTNVNLIHFYDSYPTSIINEDFGSRWAMYANTPLSRHTKESLYPALKRVVDGKSQIDGVNVLLNFVQTAFVYEYDNKVWGYDRAFFSDETLYYPYCDCEDRTILFSRLIRDLFGLKVVLIYYPGHLAAAVHFSENVTGDYIIINDMKYIICDPTYIGAPVGATMPAMDNLSAKVIMLE